MNLRWQETVEQMGIDLDLFKQTFIKQLSADPKVLDKLLKLAVFHGTYHNIHECLSKNDCECSHCYSGDTEFDMREECAIQLRNVWDATIAELPVPPNSYGEEDDSIE